METSIAHVSYSLLIVGKLMGSCAPWLGDMCR
jgi:hypothetical protein